MLRAVPPFITDVSVLKRLSFAVANLPEDLPNRWEMISAFALKRQNMKGDISLLTSQVKLFAENLQELDASVFSTDKELMLELMDILSSKKKPLGVVLISSNEYCSICESKLQIRKDRPANVIIYDDVMGAVDGTHYHKTCSNRSCGLTQFYGYTTAGKSLDVHFDANWESLQFFVSSRETAFSITQLNRFDSQIIIGQMSFKQCAEAYNYFHASSASNEHGSPEDNLSNVREKLDRRRAEAAYFQYAILKIFSWYPDHFKQDNKYALHKDLQDILPAVTEKYHGIFVNTYANHRCNKKGCGEVFVMDGNMKNHRDVCFATNAGYVEYQGLHGRVRSGCPNTPCHKSRYCTVHKPAIAIPQQEQEVGTSTLSSMTSEGEVGMIIGKRNTRQSTLYEVVWLGRPTTESTWQPEHSLPVHMVDEFNKGVLHDIDNVSSCSGGQSVYCLSTTGQSVKTQPDAKKRKRDVVDTTNSGVFEPNSGDKSGLKCNTEKDHVRLNHKTAGILAGAWPCGTITLLAELYNSESKAQVYGALHTFLQENQEATTGITCICYDDACHLKKYACNPLRINTTATSLRLTSLHIVVDKLHFRGHVDAWCHQNCDPYKLDLLHKVDTEICEQLFSWLSRYARITQHMNRQHFFFIFYTFAMPTTVN